MERGEKSRRDLETLIIQKVGEVSSSIDAAKDVDEVICALHSLAIRLFPINSSAVSSAVDERYRCQVLDANVLTDEERDDWCHAFYHGAAFPAMAKILLYNVASKWLASFPSSAKNQVYDQFFTRGPISETIEALVLALGRNGAAEESFCKTVCSNVERLLVVCLLKKEGVRRIVGEFRFSPRQQGLADAFKADKFKSLSRAAQLLASIPDKTRPDATTALSSHLFFRKVAIQLLVGVQEGASETHTMNDSNIGIQDGSLLFVGETFSRICRRGFADILLAEMVPRILGYVRSCLSANTGTEFPNICKARPDSQLWSEMMESIKDQYAIERLSEELLRHLATEDVKDVEAYWILWLLFHRTFKHQSSVRAMFVEKFLVWKVFPLCCLRWIIQFAVLECPPGTDMGYRRTRELLDIVQRLVVIWSKSEFVRSTPMEQQAYITAAVALCLEQMSKEELEATKNVLHSILQGVSCRLESPIHLIRKMASSVALVFSKVVDPKNPLYLDDDHCEIVDWEFGIIPQPRRPACASHVTGNCPYCLGSPSCKEQTSGDAVKRENGSSINTTQDDTKLKGTGLVDYGKMIDPAMFSGGDLPDEEDDVESKASEASDDSSLQPYDLSDDDTDLQRKISQLADISVALRKPDDPDSVERALDVAEHLIRASPDELHHIAGDLVRALVHVRCSDVAIEGKEDSAEGKRQKGLIALLVTCPFESLDVITKLLYSPNLDISQRILILDVMTEAAQELADAKIIQTKDQQRDLISTISDSQPWFIPSSRGPLGAGPWKEVSGAGTILNWSHRYERELPSRAGQIKKGKSRRWGLGTKKDSQLELTKNRFPMYAAAFMLPAMQGFDKRRHGVDLLNRDFIVLGKLIYMLGVCMKCTAMHPEASELAPSLLDMLRSRQVAHHAEAYVRRSVMFAVSCILAALHPSYVASALIEGNQEISNGLEWIRTWALHIAETDLDTECSMMAVRCLQLHAEMALQTSRVLESAQSSRSRINVLPSNINEIIIPSSNISYQI